MKKAVDQSDEPTGGSRIETPGVRSIVFPHARMMRQRVVKKVRSDPAADYTGNSKPKYPI
jgi:hypothetical protein